MNPFRPTKMEDKPILDQALLLFVRGHWQDCKRFGFGGQMDEAIHEALLQRTFRVAEQIRGVDIILIGDGRIPDISGARTLSQRGNDFNSRFLNALRDTFRLGYKRIVAIGGDTPTLSPEDIHKALKQTGISLGPTCDGGFYLAALQERDLPLVDGLPWNEGTVLAALLERLEETGRSFSLLMTRRDIDHADDARPLARLLLRLVHIYCGRVFPSTCRAMNHAIFPPNHTPDPRIHSLPPPSRLAFPI